MQRKYLDKAILYGYKKLNSAELLKIKLYYFWRNSNHMQRKYLDKAILYGYKEVVFYAG